MTETQTDPLVERAEKLAEKVEQGYPESWRPEAGQTLVGVFQRLESGHTSYGPAWIAILSDVASGEERSVWLLHTALRNQFKRHAPAAGELVAIKYEGKATSSTGQKYDNWTVRVDRGEAAADWSKVPGDADGPQSAAPTFEDFDPNDDVPF